ncbi:unnamed protein product [Cuscuta epithymum]|uniref:F-box domain-containing protein n=1 Tax=Cuscuta epithymum TaxID=186058 RepID=A0AAV0ELZ7_9ASTE|nr:unnamed protein product [Cuscuta epithymum]
MDKKKPGESFDEFLWFNYLEEVNAQDCFNWGLGEKMISDDDDYDVADFLPLDPFGMEIGTTMASVATITGLIEEIENDMDLNAAGFETDEIKVGKVDKRLLAEFNFMWKEMPSITNNPEMVSDETASVCGMDSEHVLFNSKREVELMGSFCYERYCFKNDATNKDHQGCSEDYYEGTGAPADAIFLALAFLGVKDLLSVERVCKPMRLALLNDPLLWRHFSVDQSLSRRITDEALLKLTDRAQGSLNYLSLEGCSKITESGLKRVLERNANLTKLSVAGCLKIRFDSLLSILKSVPKLRLETLRIGGLFGVTNEGFEELKALLGVDNSRLPKAQKLNFYSGDKLYRSLDDDPDIDIEVCPRCRELRLVYDCPTESCQKVQHGKNPCRACIFCIPRCIKCGCCVSNCMYEETFYLDNICSICKYEETFYLESVQIFLCG